MDQRFTAAAQAGDESGRGDEAAVVPIDHARDLLSRGREHPELGGDKPAPRGKQGANRALSPECERPSVGRRRACCGRRAGAQFEPSPPRQRPAVVRAAPHVALPAMRAITHVDGKPTRSSRGARRGAGCWLRTTVAPPAGRRYRAARLRGGGRRRPVVLSHTRMPGWTSRWGGVRSATLRRIKRRSTPGAGLRCFRPRLRSSARAQTARSRVVRCERLLAVRGGDCLPRPRRTSGRRGGRSPACPARGSLTETVSGGALRRVEIRFFRSYPALRALPMAWDCGSVVLSAVGSPIIASHERPDLVPDPD
jgi:hypothetical protein